MQLRGLIEIVESYGEDSDHDERDRRESRSQSRNSIAPVYTVEYDHIPRNREEHGYDIHL